MDKFRLALVFLFLTADIAHGQTCSLDIRFAESLESAGGNGDPVCGDNNQGTLSFYDVPYVVGRTVLAVYSATEQEADPPPLFGAPCAGGEFAGFDYAEGTIGGTWTTIAGADPDALGNPRVVLLCNDSATNPGGTVMLHSYGATLGAPFNNEHMAGGLIVADGIDCESLIDFNTRSQKAGYNLTLQTGNLLLLQNQPTLMVAVLAASIPDPQLGPNYAVWGPDPVGWSVPIIDQSDHASLVVDSVWVNAYANVVQNAWGVYSAAQKISNVKGTLGTIHAGSIIAAFGPGQNCSGTEGSGAD